MKLAASGPAENDEAPTTLIDRLRGQSMQWTVIGDLVLESLRQMTRTFWASSPLRPGATSNSTVSPSLRDL